jgi:membrane protease YdiL (CAAX protease family)
MSAFGLRIWLLFIFFAFIYVAGGCGLFYFSLQAPDAAPKLSVAIGWVIFYVESQGVALLAVCIFGKLLTADILIIAVALFGALPVIISSCGAHRRRIWKASQSSWLTLLFYAASSSLAVFLVGLGYAHIYALITHSSLPLQPTQVLISKVKHTSALLAYFAIAVALPVAEEIIFRSYLFDALKQRFSGKVVVIVTALAFSLIHFQWIYFIPLFGVGMILGWVRMKTDSLRLPVLLHVINNGLILALIH